MRKFKAIFMVDEHDGSEWTIHTFTFNATDCPSYGEVIGFCGLKEADILSYSITEV